MQSTVFSNIQIIYQSAKQSEGSMPLPLTRTRQFLTGLNTVSSHIVDGALELKKRYSETDDFTRDEAIAVIESSIIAAKINFPTHFDSAESDKISPILDRFKQESVASLPPFPLARKVYETVMRMIISWVDESTLSVPEVRRYPPLDLNQDDFRLASANYKRYLENQCMPYCQDFVFYKLNEEHAFPHLFNADYTPWPKALTLTPCQVMSAWGYERVEKPAPGDLVCYCSTLKGAFEAKHWGIWTPDGKVISKIGAGGYFEHPLASVMVVYGNFVYFFRKKIRSHLVRDFLHEIDKTQTRMKDSPTDPKACLQQLIQFLQKYKIGEVFKRSLYNHEYIQELKQKIVVKLNQYRTLVKDDTKTDMVFDTAKSIVMRSQLEVVGKF